MSPKVLLTAISSFVGAHILDELVKQNKYQIVGTARSIGKGEFAKLRYPDTSIEIEVVADLMNASSFDDIFQKHPDIEYVIHVASPYKLEVEDPKRDLIDPAVVGTEGILKSIKKFGSKVKKVVITSSFAACFWGRLRKNPPYTEKDWSNISMEQAVLNGVGGYYGSKTFAERAAWEFIDKEKPHFTLTTLLLPRIYGPPIQPVKDIAHLTTSVAGFAPLIDPKGPVEVEPFALPFYTDVRDAAKAHVLAMQTSKSDGHRLLLIGGKATAHQFLVYAGEGSSEIAKRIVQGDPSTIEAELATMPNYDNAETHKLIDLQYHTTRETAIDTFKRLIEIKDGN
jgi:nucleoside-diphosphate-sugar epimerase